MQIVTVISNAIENAYRKIKIRTFIGNDLQTPKQVAPFGIDSVPYDGMRAIFCETNRKGESVSIG